MTANSRRIYVLVALLISFLGLIESRWRPFECSYDQLQQIEKKPLFMLADMDSYIYFFFEKFVIKYEMPQLRNASAIHRAAYTLMNTRLPVYVDYHRLEIRGVPDIARVDPDLITGFISADLDDYRLKQKNAVIIERPNGSDISEQFKLVSFVDDFFGMLTCDSHFLKSLSHKRRGSEAVIRIDKEKTLLIEHLKDRADFRLWRDEDRDERHPGMKYIGEYSLKGLDYMTTSAIYWEFGRKPAVQWEGYLGQLDNHNGLHFRQFHFFHEKWDSGGPFHFQVNTEAHLQLTSFLGCLKKPIQPFQFKGAFVRRTGEDKPFHTFVFIDDYYFVSRFDLLTTNFVWFDTDIRSQRVQFDDFKKRPLIERLYQSHVKMLKPDTRNVEVYLTFSAEATYQLIIEDEGQVNQSIRAKPSPDVKLHLCLGSLLTVHYKGQEEWTFCFDRDMYFGYSDNDGHNVDIKVYNAVADIFADSDVDYDEEPILAVIPDYGIGRVAFMTESWILIFDSAMLQGVMVHHGKADYDRGMQIDWVMRRCKALQADRSFSLYKDPTKVLRISYEDPRSFSILKLALAIVFCSTTTEKTDPV